MPLMIINQLQPIFPYQNPFSPFPLRSFQRKRENNSKEKPKTAAIQPPNNSVQTSIQFPAGTEIS